MKLEVHTSLETVTADCEYATHARTHTHAHMHMHTHQNGHVYTGRKLLTVIFTISNSISQYFSC